MATLKEQIRSIIADLDTAASDATDDEQRSRVLAMRRMLARVERNLDRPEAYPELLHEAAYFVDDGWPRDDELGGRILDLDQALQKARKRGRRKS